jgi:hypothetical protein
MAEVSVNSAGGSTLRLTGRMEWMVESYEANSSITQSACCCLRQSLQWLMEKPRRSIFGSPAKRHVIFLGAGASKTSGYPLANELTLLMCDPLSFRKGLRNALQRDGDDGRGFEVNSVITQYQSSEAAKLLRAGDFATMDELSKHALGPEHSKTVRDLKKLMRLVLAFENPETYHYGTSDYRRMVQKLFIGNSLRKDISIISYNYDPFLDFRLLRALFTRSKIAKVKGEELQVLAGQVTSGFIDRKDTRWSQAEGFCHLKLHGACVFPAKTPARKTLPVQPNDTEPLRIEDFFGFPAVARLAALCQTPFSQEDPPALLPWEILHEQESRLLNEQEFTAAVGNDWQHVSLLPLFRSVWERARREVQVADKISFVGISLSPYLEPGLKFLFSGKRGALQLVVANPEIERFKNAENYLHPNSPAGRTLKTLERCGLESKVFASFSEDEGLIRLDDMETDEHEPSVTSHATFREFIEAEM